MINRNTTDPGVKYFLRNFKTEQLKYLRAGLSSFISEAIRNFAIRYHRNINLRLLLDDILMSVAQELITRKFLDPTNVIFQCAKVGLLLPDSYDKDAEIEDDNWFCQGFSFLQHHLYHLVNPNHSNSWIFVTCPPRPSSQSLRIITADFEYQDWEKERTFFEAKEKTTILACLFLSFGNSVTDFLSRARKTHIKSALGVYNAANRRALKLPGNPLELSAAVSIIDSSQHSFANSTRVNRKEIFSLGGQRGITFIKNLVLNMIDEKNFQRRQRIVNVNIGRFKFNLENFFKRMHVPFLYSLDRRDSFFDHLNDFSDSIYLKQYVRTGDDAQIDGKFEFKFDGHTCSAVVECKNRGNKIGSDMLEKIIKRALDTRNSKILLVFCTEMVQIPKSKSKFTDFCEAYEVNVYRIKQTRGYSYEISPFFEKSTSPKLICILFESKQINRL